MSISVDPTKLYEITDALIKAKVKYRLGAKPNIHGETSSIKAIDCSGFTQYVIYQATNQAVIFHGGSVMQREYCDKLKLEKVEYSTCDQSDGWLRIAFIKKGKDVAVGHVWLIHNGLTLESYHGGTSHGPGQRPWNEKKLKDHAYACYKLSQIFSQTSPITANL